MKKRNLIFIIFIIPLALTLTLYTFNTYYFGYPQYTQTDNPNSGYCFTCHPEFDGRGDLHDLHVGSSQFTGECKLCHIQQGDVPHTYKSGDPGDGSGNQKGCAGCHGRDYGEISEGGTGPAKSSGYGLRKWHLAKGVNCAELDGCHQHNDTLEPYPEDVKPDYYSRSDVNLTDPCSSSQEDGTPEPNGEDSVGLDNDGDTIIDSSDKDCQWTGPARIVNFKFKPNKTDFDWLPSPDATSYDILKGDLQDLLGSFGSFINATCFSNDNSSNSGSDSNRPDNPGNGFYYLVRGQVSGTAGTYNSDGPNQSGDRDATATGCSP